jgi:hypothetical protein
VNPVGQTLGRLLGLPRILVPDLRIVIMEVCSTEGICFETPKSHNLNQDTKKEMLDWIADQWEEYQHAFILITAQQKITLDLVHRRRVDDDST